MDLGLVALLQDLCKRFETFCQKERVEDAVGIGKRGWQRNSKIVKETVDKWVMRKMWEDYKERKNRNKEG